MALAAAAVTAGLTLARSSAAPLPLRFAVAIPQGVIVPRPTMGTPLAVAPDGRRIAFTANVAGVPGLWLWSAEDGEARRLEDTTGGVSPFFSPDGTSVGFFAGNDLRRVAVAGGPATTVAALPLASSATWGADGTILVSRPLGPDAGLFTVPAAGGEARKVVATATPRERSAFPRFLPDGRHYLFLGGYGRPVAERRVCVGSLDGGEPECFAGCHSQAEYSVSGHLLCVRSGTLVAFPFDARRRRVTGEAVPLARNVRWFGPSGGASFAVSADGRTLVHEPRPALSQLAWLDRSGRRTALLGEPAAYGVVRIAPDGRRIAADIADAEGRGRDVWVLDATSGVASRLTFADIDARAPVWSSDAGRLAFAKAEGEDPPPDIVALRLDGSGREEPLLRSPGVQIPRDWSPDGRLIAYEDFSVGRREQRQLWLLSLPEAKVRRVTTAPSSAYQGRFSPDGRRIAYVSEESGRPEVFVTDVSGGREPRRVSRAGGFLPRFRGDGAELYFFQPDGMMMAVPTADQTAAPRALFHLEGVAALDFDYDVARDGERFLVRLAPEAEGAAGLRVAFEWSRPPR